MVSIFHFENLEKTFLAFVTIMTKKKNSYDANRVMEKNKNKCIPKFELSFSVFFSIFFFIPIFRNCFKSSEIDEFLSAQEVRCKRKDTQNKFSNLVAALETKYIIIMNMS